MKKEKGIDDIFKHSLQDPVETEFRESDWDAFEHMLDRQKPARERILAAIVGCGRCSCISIFGLVNV
jgi:hypothetical protein